MKIGFIGCGNMAAAMIRGILNKGICRKEEIIVSNKTKNGSERSKESLGVCVTLDNRQVVKNAKIVVLAVKPQFYEEVLEEVRDDLTPEHIVIGIAPGKTLQWIEEKCEKPLKIVRLMPNTPAMVGEGMTGVCVSERINEEELTMICEITDSFGRTEVVPERLMDAVGAVSGCSPAYVCMFIEAMADAAVAQGMPRTQAYAFASQSVLGSAKMVLETGMHPGVLKDMVTSPGGTTIEGVRILEKAGFRSAVFEALNGAAEKGKRL
ncbi:MAG: pyrroline-5-carboxylate reductase [Blautia sp.]|nr:pyrroline-5-carboxylate reductase [Blautia sp.]